MKTKILALAAIAPCLAGCIALGDASECDLTAPRSASISVDGAREIQVIAVAGSLAVRGESGVAQVRAEGTACAKSDSVLEDIELDVRREGDTVVVEAKVPEVKGWNSNAKLDFEVFLPSDIPVRVNDGSGSTEIRNVASVALDDGSGSVEIDSVSGDVRIDDGSGSLRLRGIGGKVWIDDGSGEIVLTDIGDVVEIDDGSGSIEVRDARADVIVDSDGSGSISVENVVGDFLVREDGSGSIHAEDVRGDFVVERDGSGSISHERIGGRVSVPED